MAAFCNVLYLAVIPLSFACSPDKETEPKVEPYAPYTLSTDDSESYSGALYRAARQCLN
ncbi:hypothetical protein [Pontibacter pamirensis]|uniref:hypothetical protein n=1 Tax=Pontibacter pamirensis TaxID=2562824 RepID=UPI001389493B|nr:hypothetical protein [Pontibacter pamirensis]